METPTPSWDRQSGGSIDITDLNREFSENRVLVTEQLKNIQIQLGQHYDRITQIENDLKTKVNHTEFEPRDARMTRIENDLKSFMKWWIAITVTMFGAVITAAKLLS